MYCGCPHRFDKYYTKSAYRAHLASRQHTEWANALREQRRLDGVWVILRNAVPREVVDLIFCTHGIMSRSRAQRQRRDYRSHWP